MTVFASAADLEKYLGFTFDGSDLTRAELLLDLAAGEIRGFTGEEIHPKVEDAELKVFSAHGHRLFLPHAPAVPVTVKTVTEDGTALTDGDDFRFDSETNSLTRLDDGDADLWEDDVVVTYDYGFDTVPDDVKRVTLTFAARMFTNPEAMMQRRRGDASSAFASSTTEASGLTTGERRELSRYRLEGLA